MTDPEPTLSDAEEMTTWTGPKSVWKRLLDAAEELAQLEARTARLSLRLTEATLELALCKARNERLEKALQDIVESGFAEEMEEIAEAALAEPPTQEVRG